LANLFESYDDAQTCGCQIRQEIHFGLFLATDNYFQKARQGTMYSIVPAYFIYSRKWKILYQFL